MRLKWWVSLAVLVALAVPLAVGAEGLFPEERDDPALRAIGPRQQGPEVLVASAKISCGVRWRLTAYRSHMGLCLDIWESRPPNGTGGGCGFGVRGEPGDVSGKRALSYASSQEGPEGPTFIHGPTATEV